LGSWVDTRPELDGFMAGWESSMSIEACFQGTPLQFVRPLVSSSKLGIGSATAVSGLSLHAVHPLLWYCGDADCKASMVTFKTECRQYKDGLNRTGVVIWEKSQRAKHRRYGAGKIQGRDGI